MYLITQARWIMFSWLLSAAILLGTAAAATQAGLLGSLMKKLKQTVRFEATNNFARNTWQKCEILLHF